VTRVTNQLLSYPPNFVQMNIAMASIAALNWAILTIDEHCSCASLGKLYRRNWLFTNGFVLCEKTLL